MSVRESRDAEIVIEEEEEEVLDLLKSRVEYSYPNNTSYVEYGVTHEGRCPTVADRACS